MKVLLALLLLTIPGLSAGYRAGVASAKITPDLPVWLNGYAIRTHTANHVTLDLWAKALAIDDGHRGRVVIVTVDLLFLPRELSDVVASRCEKEFGLKRSQLMFNASHTHSGPAVWPKIRVFFDMNAADEERSHQYALKLIDQLVQITGESLHSLSPAVLSYGRDQADFAINRRVAQLKTLHPGEVFPAPVDHSVPVLRVSAPDGTLRAVLFGYACHNTTLTGEFYEVSSDYAGFARKAIEAKHPGVQALFLELCGADQNPSPRSRMELPEQHGKELAAAVERVLAKSLPPLKPSVRTAYAVGNLDFAPHTRAQFEAEAKNPDPFKVRRAKLMLEAYDRGAPVTSVPYPVQAIRFGDNVVLLALAGEVVVDYALRAKQTYHNVDLIVAGYSNDVMSYIPSVRVLKEGGYEASDAMIYYGQPGPYTARVEDQIFSMIAEVMSGIGVTPGTSDRVPKHRHRRQFRD
jgi:neutral ceramidase